MEESLIKKYLSGNLSPKAKERFESRLRKEPDLHETYQIIKMEFDATELLVADKLKSDIKRWEQKRKRNFLLAWIFTSLLAIFLIGLFFFLYRHNNAEFRSSPTAPIENNTQDSIHNSLPITENSKENPNSIEETDRTKLKPQERFEKMDYAQLAMSFHNSPQDFVTNLRDHSDSYDVLQNILDDYHNERLVETLEKLNNSDSTIQNSYLALRIKGNTLFLQERFKQAQQIFQIIVEQSTIPDEEVEWNLVLSKLAQFPSEKEDTLESLRRIMNDSYHAYQKEATSIFKLLSN